MSSSRAVHFPLPMFAPFKGLVGWTSIVRRSGADAFQQVGEGAKGDGMNVFHASDFSRREPLNATQLIGEPL